MEKTAKKEFPQIDREKLYSRSEAAALLEMSEATIRRKIDQGKISYFQDGVYKIKGQFLVEYLNRYTKVAI